MILKIIILCIVIFTIISVIILFALRIPKLDIPKDISQKEKLYLLDKWFKFIHDQGKFNGTILLSKHGEIIFSKSYGFDTIKKTNPLTEYSSFNLASVSKQFTAMGIVLLKNQNKLQYNDEISKYLPELDFYTDITIEQLLHHTSGLPDYMHLAIQHKNEDKIFTTSKMISLFKNYQPKLLFKPGTKFQYSNTGYVLLAEIIERVSNRPFHVFMKSHIFDPLNMNDTQVFNLLSKSEPNKRVYGYKSKYWLFGGKKISNDLNFFDGVIGDGGVYSSSHDLFLWHNALRDGTLIPNELYSLAYEPAVLKSGTKTKYGFGWFINEDKSVEHAGGWQGFTSYIYRNLEKDELIIILDNSTNTLRVNSIGFLFNSIGLNLKKFLKHFNNSQV